jgi:hypothetical protein
MPFGSGMLTCRDKLSDAPLPTLFRQLGYSYVQVPAGVCMVDTSVQIFRGNELRQELWGWRDPDSANTRRCHKRVQLRLSTLEALCDKKLANRLSPLESVPLPNSSKMRRLRFVAEFRAKEACWRSIIKVLWICCLVRNAQYIELLNHL